MSDHPNDQMSIDYETASPVDLKKTGSHVYSEHPDTKVHCLAYGMHDEEPSLWTPGMPFPEPMRDNLEKGRKFRAWNARFETDISQNVMTRLHDWPFIPSDRFVCTQAEALAMGLPAALENAAIAVGAPHLKDDEGHRIMMQLARPKVKSKKRQTVELWDYWDDPEKFSVLYRYVLQDVRTERAIVPFIKRLSPREERIYQMTLRMNERGIGVDLNLVDKLQALVDRKIEIMNEELRDITDGAVLKVSNVQAIKEWVRQRLGQEYMEDHDIELETLSKEDISELLVLSELPNSVHRVLQIRQEAGKASTAKLKAFRQRSSADGRARNGHQYYGAATGRDAARGIQTQNIARPPEGLDVDAAIADVLSGMQVETLEAFHGMSVMDIAMGCLRGCIAARPGKKLVDADLAQIEARVTGFLANETVAVDAFRDYDTIIGYNEKGEPKRKGPDIYKIAAAGIYNKHHSEITKEERGVGKIAVLALGFGGGAMALLKMARVYGIKLAPLLDNLLQSASEDDYVALMDAWDKRGKRSGVLKAEWLTAELIKILWRKANPNIVAMWREMERAAKVAVKNPGRVVIIENGHGLAFQKTGAGLRMRVPAGDYVYFPGARIRKQSEAEAKAEARKDESEKFEQREVFEAQTYVNKQWVWRKLYGGLIYQNAVQRTARDVLFEGIMVLEEEGFEMIARIHDEGLSEVDEDREGADDQMVAILSRSPKFLPALPVAADGWTAHRFKK